MPTKNLKKNSEHEIIITDVTSEGEGVGRIGEMAVFVKGGLPGERLRVKIMKEKSGYAYGKTVRILEPSAARVEPGCSVYGICGGCDLRHCEYGAQLDIKSNIVKNCLKRIGGVEVDVPTAIGMDVPDGYRNKAQFPVGADEKGLAVGFYARRSHRLTKITKCAIQNPVTEEAVSAVLNFAKRNNIPAYDEATHTGILRHIVIRSALATGEFLVCLVINAENLPVKMPEIGRLIKSLGKINGFKSLVLNVNRERTNVVMGRRVKTLFGDGKITEKIGEVTYEISPLSFFQVNTRQTEKLFGIVAEFCDFKGDERVLDLYCGAGAISLYIAARVKEVRGVESFGMAVRDAEANARLNGVTNAFFTEGLAEDVLPRMEGGFDVVILDPPEKGCDARAIQSVVGKKPRKAIYVSCNPATLARDLRVFAENGYETARVQPVDMFPMTAKVECVAELRPILED